MRPVREIAWKYILSSTISAARNARSVSKPAAKKDDLRLRSFGLSFPADPTTK